MGSQSASCPARPAGSYFVLSMFDKLWHPNLTEAEALEMMRKVGAGCGYIGCTRGVHRQAHACTCRSQPVGHVLALQPCLPYPAAAPQGVEEVKSRLVVAPPKYLVKVIDAKGIRTLGEL